MGWRYCDASITDYKELGMAELVEEHSLTMRAGSSSACEDGGVLIEVTKFAPWFTVSWNRQQLTHGITARPYGFLMVKIPVEGVSSDNPLTVDQLAELLTQTMEAVLPTCKVFIESVEEDFGMSKKEDF